MKELDIEKEATPEEMKQYANEFMEMVYKELVELRKAGQLPKAGIFLMGKKEGGLGGVIGTASDLSYLIIDLLERNPKLASVVISYFLSNAKVIKVPEPADLKNIKTQGSA